MRDIDLRIGCLWIGLALVLGVPTPAAAGPALTEIRPAMVLVGTNTEVSLIGSGFGPTCSVSVRASDIRERTTPAVPRSGTEIAVLIGGDLTARPRVLELQVRCEIEIEMVTRTVQSEWRSLGVGRFVALPPVRPPLVVPLPTPISAYEVTIPAAPSELSAGIVRYRIPPVNGWRITARWRDNSHNEREFLIGVFYRDSLVIMFDVPNDQATLDAVVDGDRLMSCGRTYRITVQAANSAGRSAPARTIVIAHCP